MDPNLTPEQLNELDDYIVDRQTFVAIKFIHQCGGIGLSDAIGFHFKRYTQLRISRPADFKCSDEEYWRDFYS